jgi:hypothetical protein
VSRRLGCFLRGKREGVKPLSLRGCSLWLNMAPYVAAGGEMGGQYQTQSVSRWEAYHEWHVA